MHFWLLIHIMQNIPISVSKSIEGMFAVRVIGRDGGDHACPGVSDKRILEHLGQFTLAERSVFLVLIQRSDAFLEGQQTLVDLSSLHPIRRENNDRGA